MAFYTIRPKSGTKTQWSTANPVLREREIGFEYPDGGLGTGEIKMKMGDGVTAWNDLEYAIMPLYIRDGQGNAVYDIPITPQPNLLDNADFKSGIINQKGSTSYRGVDGDKFVTIDRWLSLGTNVNVNDGSISIKDVRTSYPESYLIQNLREKANGTYTIYVNVESIVSGSIELFFEHEGATHLDVEEEGKHVLTVSNVLDAEQFTIKLNDFEGTISEIKIEKGSIFTGMPNWDAGTELFKCYRFFQPTKMTLVAGNGQNATYYFGQDFVVPMVKTPSLSVDHLYTTSNSDIKNNIIDKSMNNRHLDYIRISQSTFENIIILEGALNAETL